MRLDNKRWIIGSLVLIDYHDSQDYQEHAQIVLPNGHTYLIDPETIGQYIGLEDKKEDAIFEGDIVKWRQELLADMGERIDVHEGVARIYWDDTYAHFGFKAIPESIGHYMVSEDVEYEIIGNIYETPQLLHRQIESTEGDNTGMPKV